MARHDAPGGAAGMARAASAGKALRPFGRRDRLGYMFGDMGNDFTFAMMSGYLMLFLTDVFGLAGMAAGMVLMVARFWDAFADVAVGFFIDSRKAGAKGKFRPWLIINAGPVAVLAVLTFTAIPGLSETGRLVWAYVTYILWGTAYSAVNIPYGSLASVITTDSVERTSLSTFRSIGAMIANIIVTIVAPLLVFTKDKKATAGGFLVAMILLAALSFISYLFAYLNTVERVKPEAKPRLSVGRSLKGLLRNRPLLGLMLTSFALLMAMVSQGSLNAYLFKDWFGQPRLLSLAGIVTMAAMLLVMPLLSPLVKRFGKKEASLMGFGLAFAAYLVLFLVPTRDIWLFIGIQLVAGIGIGIPNVLMWAMAADAIDYQEYITHTREEGVVYSVFSFTRKMGQAAAGGFGGAVLGWIGYASGAAAQAEGVTRGIRDAVTLIPAIAFGVCLLSMAFIYNLSKGRLEEVNAELAGIRAAREAEASIAAGAVKP